MSHIDQYFEDAITILKQIDKGQIEKMIEILLNVRKQLNFYKLFLRRGLRFVTYIYKKCFFV